MQSLQRIQTQFQEYVLGANAETPAIAASVADQFGLAAERRLAIYYDAYRLRLAEALSEAFDKTHAYVGDDTFAELCAGYIDKHPSQFPNLRWFGGEFAALVAGRLPEHPVVAELAAFEWALGLAFDAADAPVLLPEHLQQIAAEEWETIGFAMQPSLQFLPMHTNAAAIWLALEKNEVPPAVATSELPCTWTIWRKELQPHFRSLDAFEALALQGTAQGKSFSAVCETASETADSDITPQIAGWLQGWLGEAMLASVRRDIQQAAP